MDIAADSRASMKMTTKRSGIARFINKGMIAYTFPHAISTVIFLGY